MERLVDMTYIINLDRASDRMAHMARQCEAREIPYVRVPAVDGKKVGSKALEKNVTRACGAFCTPFAVGCALSHMKVWKAVLKQGQERALVLEDDAVLVPDFVTRLEEALEDVPKDFDVLVLGCFMLCNKDQSYNTVLQKSFRFFNPFKGHYNDTRTWGSVFVPELFMGTHCYVVSKKGCQNLFRVIPKVRQHIDICMNHPDIKVYAVSPDLATQGGMKDSANASYKFPRSMVPLLKTIRDEKDVSLAYYFEAPVYQVWGVPCNIYSAFMIIAGLFHTVMLPYVTGFLLAELLVGGDITQPMFFYAAGWLLRRAIDSTVP